jgi:hypothetical protein
MSASAATCTPRAFGRAEDLAVDFALSPRAELVTELLAGCAGAGDAAHWWAQPLGMRIAALLRVLQRSLGGDSLELALRCSRSGCGEAFEVALPFAALQAGPAQPVPCMLPGSREVSLRLATGDDLRRWRDAGAQSGEDALGLMIRSLLLSGEAGIDDEPALAEAIAAQDPLVDFGVSCRCPACGTDQELGIDLEAQALSRLAALQRALLREVHVFASHYGWTEREVLALPAARRARYLALIEGS